LIKEIKAIDEEYKVTICGSFRRGLPTSGDIDVLLTHPKYISSSHLKENKASLQDRKDLIVDSKSSGKPLMDKVVQKLIKINFITDTMAFGETKFMVR
jgi:DNA polymerase beta